MDIQVTALCDHASDYNGKLCIMGAFDTLFARQFPVSHPMCALALRVCLLPEDEGSHKLTLDIINEDGKSLDPERMPIAGELQVQLPPDASFFTRNLIMNFQGLRFDKPGTYQVNVSIDDEIVSSLPLRVVKVDEQAEGV